MLTRQKSAKQKKVLPKPQRTPPPPEPKKARGRPRKVVEVVEEVIVDIPDFEIPEEPEEQEEVAEEFSMDWKGTFDLQYPPENPLPPVPEPPQSRFGRSAFDFEKELIGEIVKRWWCAEAIVLADETEYFRMRVTVLAVKALKDMTGRDFPALIVTTGNMLVKWVSEFSDWTDLRVSIFGNSKAERRLVNNENRFFVPETPKNFDVMLISREQFVRDSSSLPALFWSIVIIDDLAPSKAMYHQSLAGLVDVKKMYITFLAAAFESVTPVDVQTMGRVLGVESAAECVVPIKKQDIVEGKFIEEKVYLCPMTAHQVKASQDQFLRHREQLMKCTKEKRFVNMVCQMVKMQRLVATHRALMDGDSAATQDNASGKFRQLVSLLKQKKNTGRKIAVVCSDMKALTLVHTYLAANGISHMRFEGSTRPKQQEKLAKQFSSGEGSGVILIIVSNVEPMLPMLNSDTIIALDLEFSPLDVIDDIVQWYHRTQYYPQLIRLVTDNSVEKVMFESFWVDKTVSSLALETADGKTDCEAPLTGLMRAASMVFSAEKPNPSSVVLKYCSDEPLADVTFEAPENFWETIMPHVVKAPKGKPLTIQQFWTEEKVDQLYELLWDFGWNRWDRFEMFGRRRKEIETICLLFVRRFFVDTRPYPRLRDAIGSDHQSSEVKKLDGTLPAVNEKISHINGKSLLKNLENLLGLANAKPRNSASIPLDGAGITPMNEEWTLDDDKELLFQVYVNGLTKTPVDFHPEIPRPELQERIALLLSKIPARRPTIITLRAPKKFNVNDHQKIVNHLMTYGFPSLQAFRDHFDCSISDETVEKYVESLFRYCDAPVDERKKLLSTLVTKLPKYTAQKIPQRRALFEKIRLAQTDFVEYSAEDIEFLTAIAFHGMANTMMSPVLNVSCLGNCSEPKLSMRIKAVMQEDHTIRANQEIPEDWREKLPLRINDMLMLQRLGEINLRDGFHNDRYIYPVGYKCCCVCPSPTGRDNLVWMDCTITDKNGKPCFTVKPWKSDSWRHSGRTPDEPFAEIRARIMKKGNKWVPPIDGHEMFGLTSAFVHRLLAEAPGFDQCQDYRQRYFRYPISFVKDWPTIGQFEGSSERIPQVPKPVPKEPPVKTKPKKKQTTEFVPPLKISFAPLFAESQETKGVVDVRAPDALFDCLMDRYERWDSSEYQEYFPL